MTANTTLRISELDFDSIRNNLKDFLRSQSQFTDYDFEGSGMSALLDVLAYNTHYMSYYLNMVGNEAFLDSAQLRSSVVSRAKMLGYTPESMKGPVATVNIRITPGGLEDNTAGSLTIPKYTRLISEPINGINYIFATTSANVVTKSNGSFYLANAAIKQGKPISQTYTVTPGNRRFVLPSANVDLDTITVTVQESISNTFLTTYTQNEDITEITANSTVYFIEENSVANGSYVVYFGDNVLGKQPANGNIITIQYLDTHGPAANKVNNFTMLDSISGYSQNVIVTSVSPASSGSNREGIESIRTRAPLAYSAQNRAVSKGDYETLLLKDYPNIDAISVWSGEDNDPIVYGKVFISLKPKDNYNITLAEKERIKNEIIANRSVLTVFPEIVDPEYVYLLFKVAANYNPSATSLDESEITALLDAAIADYEADHLNSFKGSYRNSILHKYLDIGNFIISTEIEAYMQRRVDITTGTAKNYTIDYGVPLYRGEVGEALYTYPAAYMDDSSGDTWPMYFEEVPQSYTGIDSIDIIDPGSGYLAAPTVTIEGDGFGAKAEATILNGRVSSIKVTQRGSNYTQATVTISSGSGITARAAAKLQLRYGDIRTYYYKDNGEKVLANESAGTIDYDAGVIYLNSINIKSIPENDTYDTDVLTFNIKPERDTVYQKRNYILDIDFNDNSSRKITLIPETN